jgi:hypothetical protein
MCVLQEDVVLKNRISGSQSVWFCGRICPDLWQLWKNLKVCSGTIPKLGGKAVRKEGGYICQEVHILTYRRKRDKLSG